MVKTHDREFFFKYVTARIACEVLTNLSVRWTSPLLFNDPFDTQLDFTPGVDAKVLADSLVPLIEAMGYSDDPLPDRMKPVLAMLIQMLRLLRRIMPVDNLLRDFPRRISEEGATRASRFIAEEGARWREALRRMRLFCVSEIHDNLVMWSHYADCHRGVVLQLRCLPEKDTGLCAARPIGYKADIPVWGTTEQWVEHMVQGTGIRGDDIFKMMAFTKSEHWRYEREWRCFANNGDGSRKLCDLFDDYGLEPEEIFAVYLGCCMLPDDRTAICRIVRERLPETRLFQARRSRTKFALEFEPVE